MAHIGIVTGFPRDSAIVAKEFETFKARMQDLGWIERQNVEYHMRYSDDEPVTAAVAELARLPVDVLVTFASTNATVASRDLAPGIPTIFTSVADPVAIGLVASLSHPGGNITGLMLTPDQDPKNVELLTDVAPGLTRLAIFIQSV